MGEKSKMTSRGARFCPRIAPPYAARGPAPHRRLAPRAHPAVRAIRHLACAEARQKPASRSRGVWGAQHASDRRTQEFPNDGRGVLLRQLAAMGTL